ncbi:response regulator transcription factor [Bacillaceae bacterium Marseille-Q3522]|nr:response regulator transcription factor [Bacillaceae bacterium Marseille-Q3522]
MQKTILVVDDDRDIVRLISDSLKYEQFTVVSAYSGKEALEIVSTANVDFIILDIMMPGMDGLEVCRILRKEYNMPILILSAKDRDMDKVIGLEIGADDYMTKPFSIYELTSRVKAHFRKIDRLQKEWQTQNREELTNRINPAQSPLVLDKRTYEAFINNEKMDLSTKEFQILSYLYDHPNQVLSREQIYESVWGDEYGDINTVTVHIKNLRKKLGKEFDYIKTIWGIGYKFIAD